MKTRTKSAIIMLAISLFCVLLSEVTRVLFFAGAGGICVYELSKNYRSIDVKMTDAVLYGFLAVQALLAILHAGVFAYIICFMAAMYICLTWAVLDGSIAGKGAVYSLSSLVYPLSLFAVMTVISTVPIWKETFAIGCAAAWICDTFGLIFGTRYGKRKLAPLVSPHKTVEGSLWGAASSLLSGFLVWLLFELGGRSMFPMWVWMLTALVSSTAGQFGDLAESLLKRMVGVKDFSNLIPGHGGMFDRADSLLFSIPTAYMCLKIAMIAMHIG